MKNRSNTSKQLFSLDVLLEHSGTPNFIRMIFFFTAGIFIAFIFWASHMELNETTTAPGTLIPNGRVVKVQHPIGGVITQILFHDGDRVDSGSIIIRLDPRQSTSQWREAQEQASVNLARKALLTQLLQEGKLQESATIGDFDQKLIEEQRQLVNQQHISYQRTVKILQSQQGQVTAELKEVDAQERRTKKQITLLDEEISMRNSLVDKGLNSKVSFLTFQRQVAEYQGALDLLVATRSKLTQRLEEITQRLAETESKFKEDLYREIAQIDQNMVSMRGEKEREQLKVDYTELRAPVSGLINAMAVHSPGEVISAGQKILELIPGGAGMVAEVKIGLSDIGHVKSGQTVILKFGSYDFNRYGGMKAILSSVSPSTVTDDKGYLYYAGVITMPQQQFVSRSGNFILLPGMTVQAEIQTGTKTIMEYLLKPIYTTQTALRER